MIIYSNYEEDIFDEDDLYDLTQELFYMYSDDYGWESEDDINWDIGVVQDYLAYKEQEKVDMNWEEVKYQFMELMETPMVWKRTEFKNNGYFITSEADEVLDIFDEYIRIADNFGDLVIETKDYYNGNTRETYIGRLLTEEGIDAYNEWEENGSVKLTDDNTIYDEEFLFEFLFNSDRYSEKPRLAKYFD